MEDAFFSLFDGVSDAVLIGKQELYYENPAARQLFGARTGEAYAALGESLGTGDAVGAALPLAGKSCTAWTRPWGEYRVYGVRAEDDGEELRRLALAVAASLRNSANGQRGAAAQLRAGLENLECPELERSLAVYEHGAFAVMRDADNLSLLCREPEAREWESAITFDAERAVRELVDSLKIYLPGTPLPVECELKQPVLLQGLWQDFQRILMNLISNGVKYSPEGAPVTLGLALVGEKLRIQVRDQGTGIPPQRLGGVFRAWQLDRDLRDPQAGIGLGLFTVRYLTERMGGSLLLESQPGRGTAVTLTFPTVSGSVVRLREEPMRYDAALQLLIHMADVLPSADYESKFMD